LDGRGLIAHEKPDLADVVERVGHEEVVAALPGAPQRLLGGSQRLPEALLLPNGDGKGDERKGDLIAVRRSRFNRSTALHAIASAPAASPFATVR
jgi:hypothetical protein